MFTALLARADSITDKLTTEGIAEFTAAYHAWDGRQFIRAVELFRQATTNASATATNFYWLGCAEFHRMLQLQNPPNPTNEPAIEEAMTTAITALTTAVKLDANHAESHALLGTLYGMKIGDSLLRAVWFGPRVQSHLKAALADGATNPRVQYLLGMGQFHTSKNSAAFREALKTLLLSEKLFEAEATVAAAPLEPRWGYETCLTFIGRTYETLGQKPEAADYYRRVLALQPAEYLAREGLARVIQK